MPMGSIEAHLLSPSARLDIEEGGETTTIPLTQGRELEAALHGRRYRYREGAQRYGFYRAVIKQIEIVVGDEMYEWWPQINNSQPVGNTWAPDMDNHYAHPRRGGAVVAVKSGSKFRYLSISTLME